MMGTELFEELDFPDVPPGFESFSSFKLKIENTESEPSCSASSDISHQSVNVKLEPGHVSVGKISRSMKRRSGVNNGRFNQCSDDDSDSERLSQNFPVKPGLPKGVIRGCADCQNCQKVIARWRQEEARRPDLEEVPVFYPSEEEFRDTIGYIEKIRPKAEQYGICRIVPPPSWKPPCPLKEKEIWESSKFATRVQRVDKLQNRDVLRKMSKVHSQSRKKKRRCSRMGVDSAAGSGKFLEHGEARFGFEPGPEFTFEAFQKYADDFKDHYFRNEDCSYSGTEAGKLTEKLEPSVEMIEGEYWRVVEKPTEEIEVLYGADLETGIFGSGFPKASGQGSSSSYEDYVKSAWNLNNLPRIPGSVLCYENADISGVQVPWLYVGMCFSSFCWHVEDHHLYSLNYMHFGAPKLWYGVSGGDAVKLEDAMKKHLPDLFDEQPDLLHKLVTQLSPSILKSEGVPVYRCVQNAGEFVMTFPRAYHSGFNSGFNCAEAVNVAPIDWFPHGQCAVELYREQGRKTTISHDKLLLGAAREAVKANWELNLLRKNTPDNLRWKDVCGRDGILANSLRARVESENVRREFLCKHSKAMKMETNFDSTVERECSICFFDLHLSAAGCRCSPDRFACLNHAKQLCPCGWDDKFFLFRYDILELNLLVDALEGKLSAIYRWARLDLGLALSSCISKESLSYLEHPGETKESPLPLVTSKAPIDIAPGVTVLALEATKIPPIKLTRHAKRKNDKSEFATCNANDPPLELIQRAISCTQMKSSIHGQDDLICLSGDEYEQSNKQHSVTPKDGMCQVSPDVPELVQGSDHKLNLCDLANAALAAEANSNLISDGQKDDCFSCSTSPKDEIDGKCQTGGLSDEQNLSCHCHQGSMASIAEKRDPDASTPDSSAQNIICVPSIGHSIKVRNDSLIHRSDMRLLLDDARAFPGSPSCSQSSVDKYPRHKGPRIAKVVRRINSNVEPLEFGAVVPGNLWSTSCAIFPKGFKSCVKYIDILDPSNMGNYISEILDGGSKGPLFMVFLEHCPSEIFVHMSPTRCWEMVREKVNQEITKQHKLGRLKLPPLQPPGSLDGLEMFGFTSPAIVQGIEALDRNCVCTEYWSSRPLAQMSRCFQPRGNTPNTGSKSNAADIGTDSTLRELFKRANPDELHSLMEMVNKNNHCLITRLLNEEIQTRSR